MAESLEKKLALSLLIVLLAPLAVFIKRGFGSQLFLNIILCFIFYIPAVLYAGWIVWR